LQNHQALIVAHNDRQHPHVHIMLNRVHPERGTAWSNSWDFRRIEASLRAQEADLGLRVVPGKHGPCAPGDRGARHPLSRAVCGRGGPGGEGAREAAAVEARRSREAGISVLILEVARGGRARAARPPLRPEILLSENRRSEGGEVVRCLSGRAPGTVELPPGSERRTA
jgi:hypothetical protein